jgi:hypothetical protein
MTIAHHLCPGCFSRVEGALERCFDCGEPVWVEGRLGLIEPLDENRAGTMRGELREPGGALHEVAVKTLDIGGIRDWREYDRFRRQSEILDGLRHPRIPRPLGDFEVRGRVLHCQTLVRGRSLARRLKGARLTELEATQLALQLLELLEVVHGRGIVHRDLKPDNVVIDDQQNAWLVDFGAARRSDGSDADDIEPTVAGTPGYMAPEQLYGEFRPESDLFALGKLLAEAVGEGGATGRLAHLIARLLREDWRKRPHSAAEARAILEGESVSRRGRWWAAIAGGVAITLGLGVAAFHRRPPKAPAIADETPIPTRASFDDEARTLLDAWLAAQNRGDFDAYARLYATNFTGIRRSGSHTVHLDHEGWLADRQRMFRKQMTVGMSDLTVAGGGALFVQTFESGTYKDEGLKRMRFVHEKDQLRILVEEMLESKLKNAPAQDDDEGETCSDLQTKSGHFMSTAIEDEIALVLCTGPPQSASEEQANAGFVTNDEHATLELRRGGNKIAEMELGRWTNGWEWGEMRTLHGTIAMGKTGYDAVVLAGDAFSEGEGIENLSTTLRIIGIEGDALSELWSTSANEIKSRIDGSQLFADTSEHIKWSGDGEQVRDRGLRVESDGEVIRDRQIRVSWRDGKFVDQDSR